MTLLETVLHRACWSIRAIDCAGSNCDTCPLETFIDRKQVVARMAELSEERRGFLKPKLLAAIDKQLANESTEEKH